MTRPTPTSATLDGATRFLACLSQHPQGLAAANAATFVNRPASSLEQRPRDAGRILLDAGIDPGKAHVCSRSRTRHRSRNWRPGPRLRQARYVLDVARRFGRAPHTWKPGPLQDLPGTTDRPRLKLRGPRRPRRRLRAPHDPRGACGDARPCHRAAPGVERHATVPRGIVPVFPACLATGLTDALACSTLGANAAALFTTAAAWAAHSIPPACKLHAQDVQAPDRPRSQS